MAVTGEDYGFFWNSENGDRKYNADSLEKWLRKFFTSGVFNGELQVLADSGMTVSVGSGYANVNGKPRQWETVSSLTLQAANSTYPRIDTIVITRDNANRNIFLEVVTGAYSGDTPAPTAPVRTAEIYQLVLAQIYVGNGVTEITQADITDTRTDTELCGYVTGTVEEMDFSQFTAQFTAYFNQFKSDYIADFTEWSDAQKTAFASWMADEKGEFDTWFANLHYILDGDVAGHLQNEIDKIFGILEEGTAGSIVKIHTDEESLFNKDVTITGSTQTLTATFDASGDVTVKGLTDVGTITFTATDGEETATATLNVPYFGNYSVSLAFVPVPTGLNLADWLTAGSTTAHPINPSSYATFADVEADEEVVRQLMTVHNAVDYLATSDGTDELIGQIINSDICAKWINLRDYALDTLSANSDIKALMDTADKYGYGEWALMPQVPKMTSNTAPYGVASATSSADSGHEAYKAFDDDLSTYWRLNGSGTTGYIQYDFGKVTKISMCKFKFASVDTGGGQSGKIQASNDGTTWDDLSEASLYNNEWHTITFNSNTSYRYYRFAFTGSEWVALQMASLQFYAWQPKGNVPIMTSNTAPYGEASASSERTSGTGAFAAFNKDDTTGWLAAGTSLTGWVQYKFPNPVNVRRARIAITPSQNWSQYFNSLTISASNDGSTFTELWTAQVGSDTDREKYPEIDNDNYYLYYRLTVNCKSAAGYAYIHELQFYGRELSVSVPTMTSNTAPWGEAFGDFTPATGNSLYYAFTGFDISKYLPDNGYKALPEYVGYDFGRKVLIKQIYVLTNVMTTAKIQASNDGTTWTDLSNITQSGQQQKVIELPDNNTEYSKYRILATGSTENRTGYAKMYLYYFLCFGLDYSEREFAEGSTMKYIYDHGVYPNDDTLENMNAQTVFTDEESELVISTAMTTQNSAMMVVASNSMDFSNFSVMIGRHGKKSSNSSGGIYRGIFGIVPSKTMSYGQAPEIARYDIPVPIPHDMILDISSVNQTAYLTPFFDRRSSSIYNTVCSFTELWLE